MLSAARSPHSIRWLLFDSFKKHKDDLFHIENTLSWINPIPYKMKHMNIEFPNWKRLSKKKKKKKKAKQFTGLDKPRRYLNKTIQKAQ